MVTENMEQNVEQPKKTYKFLNDCAEIAEKIKNNSLLDNSQVRINIQSRNYQELLREIEHFVRIKVDRAQNQVSITISDVEFLFVRV
jgi:SUMO ligase MMS21 Smc5/6 complex component